MPHKPRRKKAAEERFWAKVQKTDSCWLWTGAHCQGYGKLYVGQLPNGGTKLMSAHRFSYELHIGPIPEGLTIDHLCRTPACVNPAHLEAVTMRENVLRGNTFAADQIARTHCPAGHAYDEVNTRVDAKRCRHCRACQRDRARRIRAERRAAA